MKASLDKDPISPILTDKHLAALDRRLRIILEAIRTCIEERSPQEVIFVDK